ncbi:unnamed protein product [Rotaria magnacalcarata]|uniref:Uncharacterized protein n=1 Tax=Rotaria magnacalcarata TaxID=392030 RepID=A0A8S2KDT8_9BILA|nr:unnamed protein product [Rotaria magnacalcarata]
MSAAIESSSFLSNTLKRRQQKRHEATGIEIDQYCRINDLLSGNQRTLYRLLFQLYLRYNKDSNNLLKSISSLPSVRMDADSPFL